jgi:hypothetical protein
VEFREIKMKRAFAWPDQIQGAVSLTYDDGLPVHCTIVDPLLRGHGLLATFYPMIQSDLRLHPENWRQLAAAGHELGNHTIFHPCRQASPDPYPWLDVRYDLRKYTPAHLRAELEVANLVLRLLDGQTERTYAYTCCDGTIGDGALEQSLEPLLGEFFVAARGALTNQVSQPANEFNLFDIGCISADGRSLEGLTSLVEQARTSGGWAVLMIHGIGAGTHDLYLDVDVHERFIGWLARQQRIWIAPVRTIAQFIKQPIQY